MSEVEHGISHLSNHYDVIIIGGGIIGSSIAYFLAANQDFDGTILVIEKDMSYARSSTALSVGGIRQQFSTPENIKISQFSVNFIESVDHYLAVDGFVPDISFQETGYLFLASESGLHKLKQNYNVQINHNVQVNLLAQDQLKQYFPWLTVSDIAAGCMGEAGEGWIDPFSLLMAFNKKAKSLGVTYLEDEVSNLYWKENNVEKIVTKKNDEFFCGFLVNAAGPSAAKIASMAKISLPVQSRKRFVYTFECSQKITHCPLVIDPSGVYFRPEGNKFLCGVAPSDDQDAECSDFDMDYYLFGEVIWPILANRVKYFDKIKRSFSWAGHYAYNVVDQNAIIGLHPEIGNFLFANGFSGHGLQQAPAVGRALHRPG